MPAQTATRAAESALEPGAILNILLDVDNIPRWAPVFADAVEPIDGTRYRATRGTDTFVIDVLSHPSAGAVDYLREMPDGRRGGAYIRVTPRPSGGSTITVTVPVGPNSTAAQVAEVLDQELGDLIRLAQP